MPNTFLFADWVVMEGLRLLVNELVVAEMFNTDYNEEFKKPFAIGETARVPLPQRFDVTTGMAYQPQALDKPYTTVTIDQPFGIHFDAHSIDTALYMERGRERFKDIYLKPAMARIAQEIDTRAAQWAYYNTPNVAGTLGTAPTDMTGVIACRTRLKQLACPPGELRAIVDPATMGTLANLGVTWFNPQGEISKAFKEGAIGRAKSFDWYESNSLYRHTAGTWGGAVTVYGSGQTGTSLVITATAADSFKKGDVINIAGVYAVNPMTKVSTGTLKQFVLTADIASATGGAGGDTLSISPAIVGPGSHYQNVDALPVSGQALTLFPGTTTPSGLTGFQNLMLHRDAFALVSAPLEIPKACEESSQARDSKTGISIAYVKTWDGVFGRRMTHRLDLLIGFGNLHFDSCAVRFLGA